MFFSIFFCIFTHFICFDLCALLSRRSFSHIYFCNHIFFISKSSFLFCECSVFTVLYFCSMEAISSHLSGNIDICLTCFFFFFFFLNRFSPKSVLFPLDSFTLLLYWVGQKVHLGFSIRCYKTPYRPYSIPSYRKTQVNFYGQPNVSHS